MNQELSIKDWEERQRRLATGPGIMSMSALLRASRDEPAFLVPQRIPAACLTFIVGKPGSTKSWLGYDLSVSVARGGNRPWLDKLGPREAASVLVLSYDNPTPETARRFKRLGGKADDPIHFHTVSQDPWKMPTHADELLDLCHYFGPKLVLVDSFRQAINGNENDSEAMGKVMGGYKAMAACPSQPAVVIVHHSSKGLSLEGPGIRGSGEIEGSADAVISIEDGAAKWTKTRCWRMPEDFKVAYKIVDEGAFTRVAVDQKKPGAN